MLIKQVEEVTHLNREQARKFISGLFDQAVDDVDTERLESMRRDIGEQMKTARSRGIFEKAIAALDMEIVSRREGMAAVTHRIHPQTPAETKVAGGAGDETGEIRHGVEREASERWRVTGR